MDKKGVGFIPLIALFTFLLVVGAITISVSSETLEVGKFSNKVIGGYGDVKLFRYTIDSSVEQAVRTSLYELGRNGGIKDVCERKDNYVLLNDCYDEVGGEFLKFFEDNLDKELRELNFDYKFEIISNNPLVFKGVTDKLYVIEKNEIVYKINPSFVYSGKYNLEQYEDIIVVLSEKRSCLRGNVDSCNLDWGINKDGNVIKADIEGEKMVIFDGKNYVLDNIDIKFAYDIDKSLVSKKGESLI